MARLRLLFSVLISASIFISNPAQSNTGLEPFYKAAKEAMASGDVVAAEKFLEQAIKSGNDDALTLLIDTFYSTTEKLSKNPESSKKWLELGVSNGLVNAQYYLGVMHLFGIGIPKNENEALRLFKIAAKSFAPAQTHIGLILWNGDQGLPQDQKEGLRLIKAGAENGDSGAMAMLGEIYSNGDGVPKDNKEALFWFTKSADAGHQEANYVLGTIFRDGKGVSKDIKKTVSYFKVAADLGHAKAQDQLAMLYGFGNGVEKNIELAIWYARPAALQGQVNSQLFLGVIYDNGDGVEKDLVESVKWYRMAAENGHPAAQVNIGVMYDLQKREVEALKWYLKAAEQGDVEGQKKAASVYLQRVVENRGNADDLKNAFNWHAKAVAQGDAEAFYGFSLLQYLTDQFLPAYVMANLAATQGYAEAIELRDNLLKHLTNDDLNLARSLTNECMANKYKKCRFK